jgi:ribosomal protein S18 acetylase RimI-like enzyme
MDNLSLEQSAKIKKELDDLTVNNKKQYEIIKKACGLSIGEPKPEEKSKLAYFNDLCVGGVTWKHQSHDFVILDLAVLKAYRNYGLGKMLVEHIINEAREFKPSLLETKPDRIVAESDSPYFAKLGFSLIDGKMVYSLVSA